jgi:ketosteroid isomerase-like protein
MAALDEGMVQSWLDRYVDAWRANEPERIRALFSADATYRYHPYDEEEQTLHGAEAIVASWLENPDDPASWDARYAPYAIDGDRAVAIGRSHYRPMGDAPERTYWNCFLMRFDAEGRCAEFTEYYVRQPAGA